MSKQATTTPADQHDAIAVADRAAQAAREQAEQAKRIREQAQRQIQEAQAQIERANAEEKAAAEAERQAANDRLAAERARMADEPIDLGTAQKLAEDLLELAEGYRDGTTDRKGRPYRDARRFWEHIDSLRCRLATPDVSEDARELTLTIEWVLGVADRWEKARFRSLNSSGISDTPEGEAPPYDRRFQSAEKELQAVLDGQPPRPLERVGELIQQQVPPAQMAKMLGFLEFGGVSETDRLGAWVDRAFEAAGVERGLRRAVVEYAGLNLDDAWQMRQRRVETGMPDRLVPGTSEEPGSQRPGREMPMVGKNLAPSGSLRRSPTIVVPADGELPEEVYR